MKNNLSESAVSKAVSLELYRKVLLIRRAEEAICRHYPEDEMKTPVHLSLGAEAISAGVVTALKPRDQVFGSYRSHGIYLSKTGETDRFFAELYGKKTGLAQGKAGSMHLSAPESGFLGTSAIVAGHIPVAVGAAYANKELKNGSIVAVFFGDGATEEGGFWESLNLACLLRLPLLFICEDNELAVYTSKEERRGYSSLTAIVSRFHCHHASARGTDAEMVYDITRDAVSAVRKNRRPFFLHFRYYRYKEHVGVCEDFHCGHREKEEFERWLKYDPLKIQRKRVLTAGYSEERIRGMESEVDAMIERSVQNAKEAPFAAPQELCGGIYSCDV